MSCIVLEGVLVRYLESVISTQRILHSINWKSGFVNHVAEFAASESALDERLKGTHKPNKHMLEQALSITKLVTTMDCTNLWWFSCSLHFYGNQMNLIWDLLLHVCLWYFCALNKSVKHNDHIKGWTYIYLWFPS